MTNMKLLLLTKVGFLPFTGKINVMLNLSNEDTRKLIYSVKIDFHLSVIKPKPK